MRGLPQTTHTLFGVPPLRQARAIRISLAIRDDLLIPGRVGTVAGVHRSAINVRRGTRIVTIAHEAFGGLPNGLSVGTQLPLDRLGIRSGMAVYAHGSALSVPAASLLITISAAAGWSPTMPVWRVSPADRRWARAAIALKMAAPTAPRLGLGPLLGGLAGGAGAPTGELLRTACVAMADLIAALQAGPAEMAVRRAAPLVGLGPGATPSGDDLLVGLSAGLSATGHRLARPFARGVAFSATGRTTSLAESFLWHAGRGEFAERVQRTTAALLTGDAAAMQAGVHHALAWGASSGADLLVGLLIGIRADDPELPARLRAAGDGAAAAA